MASKADFTDEEWTRLVRAPFVAGMGITLADPGGPIEAFHETKATLTTVRTAESGDRGELAGAIAGSVAAMGREHKNPLSGFKPTSAANAGVEILDELRAVDGILAEKATPEDANAVRAWLLDTAQAAADAAKEGGFMGWHAERVSAGEQKMLDSLRDVLSVPDVDDDASG